jgi:hypothetical protein
MLVLLFFQYYFGISDNFSLSNVPAQPPISFSVSAIMGYLTGPASVVLIHAFSGLFLFLFSFVIILFSARSEIKILGTLAILGTIGIAGAMTSGLLFVLSGFQNDGASLGMAIGFILTFSVYFVELYFSRGFPQDRGK